MKRPSRFFIALAVVASCVSAAANPTAAPKAVVTAAPPGAEAPGVDWRSVNVPGAGTILLAVARPAGKGPFPAVLVLHGSHGFAREYVQLAKDLSSAGVVAVAACWFAPGEGVGVKDVSPLACPADAPRITSHQSEQARAAIEQVVRTVGAMPGVQADRIALFGHSRGGGAAWNYVLRGGRTKALILNSAGYTDELIRSAPRFGAPVLILHGENDSIGPMTNVRRPRKFENALRLAGRPVEASYYKGGEHNSLFSSPSQRADEISRMKTFLRQYLRRN